MKGKGACELSEKQARNAGRGSEQGKISAGSSGISQTKR